MNQIQLYDKLKGFVTGQYNGPAFKDGDVYVNLNGSDEIKYPFVNVDITSIIKRENVNEHSIYVYYVDRVNEDSSNINQIQVDAARALEIIIDKCLRDGDMYIELPVTFNIFEQQFADRCAGAWMQVSIQSESEIDICEN